MDTVLLTGITGFLGGHIATALLNAGYHVRGSLRNPDRIDATRTALAKNGANVANLDFITLDLTDDAGWDAATNGARFMIHSASPFVTSMPRDKMTLITPAVTGTERALHAAKNAGIERVVLTSSTVAITNGRGINGPKNLGPDDWADPDNGNQNAYAESKIRAEQRAWEILPKTHTNPALAVINPGFITGPLWDNDVGTSGALVQRFLRGQIPLAPQLCLHTVDVRDLAQIHVNALTDPKAAGRRNPSAFHETSIMGIAKSLKSSHPTFAKKMPKFIAPNWFIRAYALFDSDMRGSTYELGYYPHVDAQNGKDVLGRTPISNEQSLSDMAQSLIDRGLI